MTDNTPVIDSTLGSALHPDPDGGLPNVRLSPVIRNHLEAKRLARWFWLRLAGSRFVRREPPAMEETVRRGLGAWGPGGAEPWETLILRLGAAVREEAPTARTILERLHGRLAPLAAAMELDETACSVLILGVALCRDAPLEELGDMVARERPEDAIAVIAEAIEAPEDAVAAALRASGPLRRFRLMTPRSGKTGLRAAIEPVGALRWSLFHHRPLESTLLRRFFTPFDSTRPTEVVVSHWSESIRIVRAFLRSGPRARVLLHGKRGVGKTAFLREVVGQLGWSAFVADLPAFSSGGFGGADADPVPDFVVSLLRHRASTVLVFDDATGVLSSSAQELRDWLDALAVPSLWLVERLDLIDSDLLESFDYVLEIEPPPLFVRRALLERALEPLGVSLPVREHLAGRESFLPADVARLARAVPLLVAEGLPVDEAAMVLAVRDGRAPVAPRAMALPAARAALPYRLEWIHANVDVDRLVEGLNRTGAGTLLFAGPSGTGKTELARHLASRLGRPLCLRVASDLYQPCVGQTEQAMAKTFAAAAREGALLLIDEVDSLLRTRELALRSWEISHVNEMLVQIDRFPGVAILTTNAPETLDRALMRRIDRKIEFDYVSQAQRWNVFAAAADTLGISTPAGESPLVREVEALSHLALGDVAIVLRGERLEPTLRDAAGLYRGLRLEIGRRTGVTRAPIGFVSL